MIFAVGGQDHLLEVAGDLMPANALALSQVSAAKPGRLPAPVEGALAGTVECDHSGITASG